MPESLVILRFQAFFIFRKLLKTLAINITALYADESMANNTFINAYNLITDICLNI